MSGLDLTRSVLSGRRAWLVGGAVRDHALGRDADEDIDIVLDGEVEEAARQLARAARRAGQPAACFALSEEFGGWRVVARDGAWQVDIEPMRGGSLEADLLLRDFTVNAVAEPIAGGVAIDPLGGLEDLAVGVLRAAGPSSFEQDPLRVLRLVRIVVELGLRPDRPTLRLARAAAGALRGVAAERAFAELSRVIAAPHAVNGLQLLGEVGATAALLPELEALRGVQQSRYHHLDVYDHTIEVLAQTIALQRDPEAALGEAAADVLQLLSEPIADGLTRGVAMRWGALLHDIAKPVTRADRPSDGRVTFMGHDRKGAQIAAEILHRLRGSERLITHVAALVRHHLRLGFLVHEEQPLARRTVFSYMRATEPVEVDVTLLSVADRLATRGERAEAATEAHLHLARRMLSDALRWRRDGAPKPLVRGDELAAALGIVPGPTLGRLIESLIAAQYAGEVATPQQAILHARTLLDTPPKTPDTQ